MPNHPGQAHENRKSPTCSAGLALRAGTRSSRSLSVGGRQCVQTFGESWKRQLQAKERRNVVQEGHGPLMILLLFCTDSL